MAKLKVAFRNFMNAPKSTPLPQIPNLIKNREEVDEFGAGLK